jgi:hypothetical protein
LRGAGLVGARRGRGTRELRGGGFDGEGGGFSRPRARRGTARVWARKGTMRARRETAGMARARRPREGRGFEDEGLKGERGRERAREGEGGVGEGEGEGGEGEVRGAGLRARV